MSDPRTSRTPLDSDAAAVRRASRNVGLQITTASAIVVVGVLLATFLFVLSEISPAELFEPIPDPDKISINAITLLRAGVLLGVTLIVLAGILSWFVTRRAVRPLGEALRMQRSFVADASHELRTPLTVLDARLQVLQRGLATDDPSAPIVADLRRDAKSLIQIVNDLLESADTTGPSGDEPGSDLVPALELAVESMRLLAAEKSVTIQFDRPDPLWTTLPESSGNRCLVALLDNALRFSPTGSTIRVETSRAKSAVTVTVRDEGTGIRGVDPTRIFDRFAHSSDVIGGGGDTRTGFGIGLALVRDIVVRAGGQVRVDETSPTGTAISFTVPHSQPG